MLNRFRMLVACALTFALCWVPGFAFAGDAEDGAQVAATAHGLSYGIEGFERLAKGTARAMEGQPEGFRFPVDEDVDLVVAPAADRVVVWISPKAVEKFGLDPQDNECVSGLKALVCELDSANSMGGAQLGDVDLPWYVTAETTFDAGGYTYGFDERGADGDRYVVIASASGDAKGGARWLDSAQMVEASSVVLRDEQGPLTSLASFLGGIDYRPFWVSIKTSGLALVIAFALGLFAAWKTLGTSSRIKGLLDSVFTIPMVLPPTVCGFLLLMLFGRSTGVGQWLIAHGISIVFTWPAAVVSAGLPHGARSLREPRHADARRRANLGVVRTSHLCQAHDAARLALNRGGHGARLRSRDGRVWLHAVLCGQLRRHYADHSHCDLL